VNLFFLLLAAQEPSPGPPLVVEPAGFDFGDVTVSDVLEGTLTIINPSETSTLHFEIDVPLRQQPRRVTVMARCGVAARPIRVRECGRFAPRISWHDYAYTPHDEYSSDSL
jgi:hypothetical protein